MTRMAISIAKEAAQVLSLLYVKVERHLVFLDIADCHTSPTVRQTIDPKRFEFGVPTY
jgi:hypothetical protein